MLTGCKKKQQETAAGGESQFSGEEITRKDGGIELKTVINGTNVNLREFPTVKAKSLGQLNTGDTVYVLGFSADKETIDGFNGHWLYVATNDAHLQNSYSENGIGWVFSKFADLPANIQASVLTTNGKLAPAPDGSVSLDDKPIQLLPITVNRNGKTKTVDVPCQNFDGDFFVFQWGRNEYTDSKGFFHVNNYGHFYTEPIGVFIWNKKTNEIKHASYVFSYRGVESYFWFGDAEKKYFLMDDGTSAIRPLTITNTKSKMSYVFKHDKQLFQKSSGSASVSVYESIDMQNPLKGLTDPAIIKDVKEAVAGFEKIKSEQQEMAVEGLHGVIIKYDFIFATDTLRYTGCSIFFNGEMQ